MSPSSTRAWVAALLGIFLLFPSLASGQDRPSDVLKRATPPEHATEDSSSTADSDAEAPSKDDASAATETTSDTLPSTTNQRHSPATAIVIPIDDQIAPPILYIVRRGLKEAIEKNADAVILHIDSPGGRVDIMLEIMEALDRFDGEVIAFVDDEALSAAALIASISDEIWYTPKAVIGSAGLVSSSGEDVGETMRHKVESYVQAKLEALSRGNRRYGPQVVRAMMDADYEFKIGDTVISPEGDMLNLTAEKALTPYGTPPQPLFGDGKAESVADLLSQRFGDNNWEKVVFEVTWSEELAKWLTAIGPILLALGVIGLFIEFKTPGFGFFGIAGISALIIFFLSNYVAGLAGMEPLLVMLVGLALIAVDIFLLPGTIIPSIIGLILIFGSFLWSMTDIWPEPDGEGVTFEWSSLQAAAFDLSLGVLLSGSLIVVLWNVLPKTHLFDRLILGAKSASGEAGEPTSTSKSAWPEPGAEGVVTRPLHPGGEIEIDGHRYFARVNVGTLPKGARVRVLGRIQSGVEVESA